MSVAIGPAPQGTRVPPSLNKYPATAVPLFLALTKRETYEIEKWRRIKNSEVNGKTFILPAPKSGMAHGTHSSNLDEATFWQTNSFGDKARMVFGDTIYMGIGNLLGTVTFSDSGVLEEYNNITGGSSTPKDLTAIQYKGMKKRAYSFSFELFAYDQDDFLAISNFIHEMHAASMPKKFGSKMRTPAAFRFRVLNASGTDVTNNFFLQPKPCTMMAFNSTGLDYLSVSSDGKYPARVGVNMVLGEIEPVVYVGSAPNGQVLSVFEAFEEQCSV